MSLHNSTKFPRVLIDMPYSEAKEVVERIGDVIDILVHNDPAVMPLSNLKSRLKKSFNRKIDK